MRTKNGVAVLAVIGASLVSWAALALAQPGPTRNLPPADQKDDSGYTLPPSGQPGAIPASNPEAQPPAPVPQVQNPAPPNPVGVPMTMPAAIPATERRGAVNVGQPVAQPVGQPIAQPVPAGAEEPQDLGPGVTKDNTTGRQEPAVSLEWIGPPAVKVNQPADYTLAVRNVCNIAVQQVMVRVRVPAGMEPVATEPKATLENNIILWELGNVAPRQEKNLIVRMVPKNKGDMGCQAWVTFTGSSSMSIRVREPKLVLKASAPEKVMFGDAATFMLTVTNPGDGPADMVKIHAALSEGLEYVKGKNIDFDIGNLAPGESRSVQVVCATKSGGVQQCEGLAEADGGLKSADRAACNVIMPQIKLEVAGPKLRYLDRKAEYKFTVSNPGDASATNVTVQDVVPAGFKYLSSSDGGRHDFSTRTVSWYLGEIGPGQSREVKLDVMAINPGEHSHKATALASRGLKVDNELTTRVEGLSAILLEVVDTEDPLEVGAETVYEIRITNTGSKTETDIKLVCNIPEKMEFKGAQGPTRFHAEGRDIVFDALPKLAPRADAIYRITAKGVAPGDVRFKSQITSTLLQEPVIEMEATRIYAD
jgi:uncharacterized repeat protein (TIGR01451 family)